MTVVVLDAGEIELAGRRYKVSVHVHTDPASSAIRSIDKDSERKKFDAAISRQRHEGEPLDYTTVHFTEQD